MSNSDTPTASTWCAWARRGTRGRWQRLATASTDAEALEAVRRLTATWQHADLCCLPEGRDPNEDKDKRPR